MSPFDLGTVDTPSLQERIQARPNPEEVGASILLNVFKSSGEITPSPLPEADKFRVRK